MGDFFKSTKFKILLCVFVVIFFFMLNASRAGGMAPITSRIVSYVAMPFQRASAYISEEVGGVFAIFANASSIAEENEELRAKVDELNQKMIEYDTYKRESQYLKEFLEIKGQNPTLDFEPATVIARDANDRFYSFTIDKGSSSGIEVRDAVITPGGLVGVVSEVGDIHAKVITIIDISLEVSAVSSASRDIGIAVGSVDVSQDGNLLFTLLDRDTELAEGDLIVTSGYGGQYPSNIVIGTVIKVEDDPSGTSKYAVIEPAADPKEVSDVLVIKDFYYEESMDEEFRAEQADTENDTELEDTEDPATE